MRHVLVAVDFSACSRSAFEYGAALARRLSARLSVVHVAPYYAASGEWTEAPARPSADPERWDSLHEELREISERCEDLLGAIVLREGDPADEILAWAAAAGVDLIVLGTHGRRGIRRWISGSVTERVARTAHCPVIAVPHGPVVPFERILCAVDLTVDSFETVAHAAAVARAMGASLVVLHTLTPPPPYEPWMIPPRDDESVRRRLEDGARTRLAVLVATHAGPGLTVDLRVVFGRPADEIERLARARVALTVLGVRSSRAIERFVFGSTAWHVLRAGVGPVMVVPHGAAAAAAADRDGEREKSLASS